MYLYFEDKNGNYRYIGEREAKSIDDALTIFNPLAADYVHTLNPNYEIHYIRAWGDLEEGITLDVGSHTEFSHIVKERREEDREVGH